MVDENNQDIFSSIKKMVESEENSSVLELTDMVTPEGKIVKVSKGELGEQYDQQGETDVGTFLKLMQNNNREAVKQEDVSSVEQLPIVEEKIESPSPKPETIDSRKDYTESVKRDPVLRRTGLRDSNSKNENQKPIDNINNRRQSMSENNEKVVPNLSKHLDETAHKNANSEYIRRIVQTYVKGYLEVTLPSLVKKTVEEEVRNMLKNMM